MVMVVETPQRSVPEIFPPSVPREVTLQDALYRAADYMDEHGWFPRWNIRGGGVCVYQAIYFANPVQREMLEEHQDKIQDLFKELTGQYPAFYNDFQARSKEEVVGVLREAAERA